MKRIKKAVVILLFFLFIHSVAFCFYKMFLHWFSGKPMGAVSIFMTGNYLCQPGGQWDVSFLLDEVVVATVVAFFVVVLLLTSLDVMFSFHRYRHSDNKNEIKWLKNTKKIARKLTSRFATLCVLEKPIS